MVSKTAANRYSTDQHCWPNDLRERPSPQANCRPKAAEAHDERSR
jgi:hypothetical protein